MSPEQSVQYGKLEMLRIYVHIITYTSLILTLNSLKKVLREYNTIYRQN